MAINPAIAMGVQPLQLPDPLAAYGKFAAIQQAQNQNALAQYQLAAAQRAEAKDLARTNALAQAGSDETAVANALLRAGDLQGYTTFLKANREASKAQVDLVDSKLKQARTFLDTIDPSDPNAPQQYLAWHQANHADPVLGPVLKARGVTAEQSLGRIQQAIQQGPAAFAQLLNQSKLGTEKFIELNKPTTQVIDQSGQRQIVQIPGLGGAPTTVGTYADVPLPPSVEAQKVRIAQASRPPKEPKESSKAVKAIDPSDPSKVIFVSAEEAIRRNLTPAEAQEGLTVKERQTREAKYPQATTALKTFDTASDALIKDLETLIRHPGLGSITGIAAGRIPGITKEGREAEALYDKIVARGGFQELQNMRQASPTGGALGNVSNREGDQLKQAFAAIDRRQDADSVRKAAKVAIDQIRASKANVREAYDLTYEYKQGGAAAAAPSGDVAAERAAAKDAIAKGAPADAVRRRFKEKTGQEL